MNHPAQLPEAKLLAECTVTRTRGSGPGGQHRNKVETAIVVEHTPTGLRGEASERRSQKQNRQQAILRLRIKLALKIRREPAEQPSTLWLQRASGGRISVSAQHEDFPTLLAEALDLLHAQSYALPASSKLLGISSSQLVKLLKVEPAALVQVNHERQDRGESPLR